jgi:hypothetical protein
MPPGPPYGAYAIAFSLPSNHSYMSHDFDQWCTAPIYNYACFLSWTQDIEDVCHRYNMALSGQPQHSNIPWRCIFASLLALLLQWGTSGAAVVVNWYTPTTGKTANISDHDINCTFQGLGAIQEHPCYMGGWVHSFGYC